MMRTRVTFVTIVPSPYQRDLFAAIAVRPEFDVRICYLEAASPDSPWPAAPLRDFEHVLPGFWIPFSPARFHVNWDLPSLSDTDFVVLSSFSSVTGQRLMRRRLKHARWIFWGERLRPQGTAARQLVQGTLISPLRYATAIVGMGRLAEADYAARFPGVPHFSIPYHCDLKPFLAIDRSQARPAPLTFLFCGQMIARKGVDLLLEAFDRMTAEGTDARLLLVGREAELSDFMQRVSPRTREKITYAGFQAPEALTEFFAKADVFVLPSRHDGWGVVVNQAIGAGLPVITSDAVGAGLDLVDPEANGLLFPAGDVDALYRCMKRLALDPALAHSWGLKSREKAFSMTPEAGAEKWVRVFETLSRNENPSR